MNAPVVALLLAVAALAVAPMLAWATARSERLESGLDGFVFVLVAGVALLHLGPHAIDHGGLMAFVGIGAGAVLPVVFRRLGRTRLWVTTALGVLGLHALVEGAAVGMLDASLTAGVGAGVIAHRLPVGLAVVAASRSPLQAALALAGLSALTVLGFGFADVLGHGLPHGVESLTEGVIVGGLLHVVFSRPAAETTGGEVVAVEPAQMTFTRVAQPASLALSLPQAPACDHDHHHGHHHHHGHEQTACDHHPAGHDDDHDANHHHGHDHHHGHGGGAAPRASAVGAVLATVVLAGIGWTAGPALDHLQASSRAFVTLAVTSAPALLIGFVLAGLVSSFLDAGRASWLSGGGSGSQALRGVVFGLPLPVCSCGVVPMYESLIRKGVPVAAGLAFLVATPELGLDAVLLSVPLLGVPLTVARVVAAFVVAFVVAVAVSRREPAARTAPDEAPGPKRDVPTRIREGLRYGLVDLVDHTLPWILVGLMLAALAEPLMDYDVLAALPPVAQVPLAALVGIPIYVCASGATPLAAVAVHKGLSSGAALAFLLAGPATNVTTFGILSALHGRRLALRFGVALTVCAVLMGWGVDAFGITVPEMGHPDDVDQHAWSVMGPLSAVGVALLALSSLWRQGVRGMAEHVLNPIHVH